MACWMLWQRLPPRYQLTAKEPYEDVLTDTVASPRTPSGSASGRRRSGSGTPRSARTPRSPATPIGPDTPRSQSRPVSRRETDSPQGHATMYFTVASPRDVQADIVAGPKPSFPARTSGYVTNFKHQQRINSARQSMEDPSTTIPKSYTPKLRAKTAPPVTGTTQFPVTMISSHAEGAISSRNVKSHFSHPGINGEIGSPTMLKTKPENEQRKRANLAVNTLVPFEDMPKPYLKNPLYPEKQGKRYVVRHLDNSLTLIDSNKVVVVKPSSRNTDSLKKNDSSNYLAHLRRLYLNSPRDLAKCSKDRPQRKSGGTVIRERLEYEKKTENILSYYSREDDRASAHAWSREVEESQRQRGGASMSARDRGEVRFSPRVRQSSARSRPRSVPRDESPTKPRTPRVETCADALSDWGSFLKINARSLLHDRQFYLQTPKEPERTSAQSQCECRLCRLEVELGLSPGRDNFVIVKDNQGQPGKFPVGTEFPHGQHYEQSETKNTSLGGNVSKDKHQISEAKTSGDTMKEQTNDPNSRTRHAIDLANSNEAFDSHYSTTDRQESPENQDKGTPSTSEANVVHVPNASQVVEDTPMAVDDTSDVSVPRPATPETDNVSIHIAQRHDVEGGESVGEEKSVYKLVEGNECGDSRSALEE